MRDLKFRKCKNCEKEYHFCYSCSIEEFYFYYCSKECLEEDGKMVCPHCFGWADCNVCDTNGFVDKNLYS